MLERMIVVVLEGLWLKYGSACGFVVVVSV